MKIIVSIVLVLFIVTSPTMAESLVVNTLIEDLKKQGNLSADESRGEILWQTKYPSTSKPYQRSCSSCHTANLAQLGTHIKTGRKIIALAPSINSKSLTKVKKINKWLKRNCQWTLGRECNLQEKADLLAFIKQQ